MIEGQSIICFAHDWKGDPTSKTHIMRILSERNRILWVNSIGMRRPTASARDFRRIAAKLKNSLQGCHRVHDNLHVWNPLVLPLPGVAWAERVNTWLLSTSIRRLVRRLGLHDPILWTFLPNVTRLIGRLGERMVIYHCVDEYSAFSGVSREQLQHVERELIERAAVVFTSSEELCRERQVFNPRTFFVSHGVDVTHFSRALDPGTTVPRRSRAHCPTRHRLLWAHRRLGRSRFDQRGRTGETPMVSRPRGQGRDGSCTDRSPAERTSPWAEAL